jgi:hypothetical protein
MATKDGDTPLTPEGHWVKGLREDYPDLAEFDDDVLVQAVRESDFSDVDDSTFKEAMKVYEPAQQPAPKQNIFQQGAGFIKNMVGEIAQDYASAPAAIGRVVAENPLEKPLTEMEQIGYKDLISRGYSPKIAQHVMKQRLSTQQEMAGEMQALGEEGQKLGSRGAAAYVSTGIGLGAEQALLSRGLGHLVKHATTGAIGFSGYEGIKAAGEGKPAGEVFDATLRGAVGGAVLGVAIPSTVGVGKKMLRMAGAIPRAVEKAASAAAIAQRNALARQAEVFADKFNADWLRTRFSDLPIVQDPNAPAELLAATMLQRIAGQDVAESASEAAVARIAEKVRIQRANIAREPGGFKPPSDPIPMDPNVLVNSPNPFVSMPPRMALDLVTESGRMQRSIGGGLAPDPTAALPKPGTAGPTGPAPEAAASSGARNLGEYTPESTKPPTPPTTTESLPAMEAGPIEGLEGNTPPGMAAPEALSVESPVLPPSVTPGNPPPDAFLSPTDPNLRSLVDQSVGRAPWIEGVSPSQTGPEPLFPGEQGMLFGRMNEPTPPIASTEGGVQINMGDIPPQSRPSPPPPTDVMTAEDLAQLRDDPVIKALREKNLGKAPATKHPLEEPVKTEAASGKNKKSPKAFNKKEKKARRKMAFYWARKQAEERKKKGE